MWVITHWEDNLVHIKPTVLWHGYWENARGELLPCRLKYPICDKVVGGGKLSPAWSGNARLKPYRFFGLFESGYKISWAERTWGDTGFLPPLVTASFCVPGSLFNHTLWCQQLVWQLVINLAFLNMRLLWPLIKSCEPACLLCLTTDASL